MKYPVILHPRADQQLENIVAWWAENRSSEQAERWYVGFVQSLKSLAQTPDRHELAAEDAEFPFEVRELRYGLGKRPTHRALFTVRPDMVYVLLVRHLAQRDVSLDDL
jgi:plasmid stabilization system protein ParE